jgi:hypothetical protein
MVPPCVNLMGLSSHTYKGMHTCTWDVVANRELNFRMNFVFFVFCTNSSDFCALEFSQKQL